MPGKQAKTFSTDHIDDLLFFAERSRHPLRNRLIVLLSVKAGLRAAEIAKLSWDMVLDPSGAVGGTLVLQDQIAKKRSGRTIPIHADLRQALVKARQLCNGHGPVVRSERGGAMTPMSIVGLVQPRVRAARVRGMLVALRSSNLHHASGARGSQGRRLAARRPTAGWPPVHSDHAALH